MAALDPEIKKLAQAAARRYTVRTAWACDREDVEQSALLAMTDALPRFDPTRGVDRGAYLWEAAKQGAKRAVVKAHSPMTSVPGMRAATQAGRMSWPTREGVTRVSSDGEDTTEERSAVAELNADADPEALVSDVTWRRAVRERLRELLGRLGSEFAIGAVTGEWTAGDIAGAHGVHLRDVEALRASVRKVLSQDEALFRLWEQRVKEQG